ATVVQIVSGLTGYPPELLDVDLDLEADLGVDTVKQAEVFAAVRERFTIARDDNLKLRDFPTLTHVIGWVRERTGAGAPAPEAPAAAEPAGEVTVATGDVPRRVPVTALRPDLSVCEPTGVRLADSRIAVMPDEGGIGEALVARLRKLGAEVVMLDPGLSTD